MVRELNLIWSILCGLGLLWVGLSCRPGAEPRPEAWRRLWAAVVLAGFLFPAISANDDLALWRLQSAQLYRIQPSGQPQAGSVSPSAIRLPASSAPGSFWWQFQFLSSHASPSATIRPRTAPFAAGSGLRVQPIASPRRQARAPPARTRQSPASSLRELG